MQQERFRLELKSALRRVGANGYLVSDEVQVRPKSTLAQPLRDLRLYRQFKTAALALKEQLPGVRGAFFQGRVQPSGYQVAQKPDNIQKGGFARGVRPDQDMKGL